MTDKPETKLKDYSEEVATLIPEYQEQVTKDVGSPEDTCTRVASQPHIAARLSAPCYVR